jgi:anaerobic C4-dicarboxylate transporter
MCNPSGNDKENLSIQLSGEISKGLTIHKNIKQEIIVTTIDKVKILLMERQDTLLAKNEWIAPAGMLITLIATLLTTDFKEKFGYSKDFWNALFIMVIIFCIIWLIKALIKLTITWKKGNLKEIIEQLTLKE